jgi:hypothetical protein
MGQLPIQKFAIAAIHDGCPSTQPLNVNQTLEVEMEFPPWFAQRGACGQRAYGAESLGMIRTRRIVSAGLAGSRVINFRR